MKRSIHHLIADGVVGGLLAGLVVALWFLVVDSVAGRPFHTPAALAATLAGQEVGPPTLRLVVAYSLIHFGVFALLGVANTPKWINEYATTRRNVGGPTSCPANVAARAAGV